MSAHAHLESSMSCTCQCQSHRYLQHRQRLQLCLCGDRCRKALAAGSLRAICSSSHELFCNQIKRMSFYARDSSTLVMKLMVDNSKQKVGSRSTLQCQHDDVWLSCHRASSLQCLQLHSEPQVDNDNSGNVPALTWS